MVHFVALKGREGNLPLRQNRSLHKDLFLFDIITKLASTFEKKKVSLRQKLHHRAGGSIPAAAPATPTAAPLSRSLETSEHILRVTGTSGKGVVR